MSKHRSHFVTKSVSYEWKIQNFLDQTGRLDSPTFLLSNTHFSVQIYPNGQYRNLAGYVSIYLNKQSSQRKLHIECTLKLILADGFVLKCDNFSHLFPPENKYWGYSRFIERSALINIENNVLRQRGTWIIFCEVRNLAVEGDNSAEEEGDSTMEAETQTSSADTIQSLSKNFEEIYVSGCQTDVVMYVRGEKFAAHRLILLARFSVFRSMFEHDMKETETGVINITDCDPESFGALLLFLYSGKLDVVTSDNALDLYITADKYNVQELKKECSECLVRDLNVDSFCDVIRLTAMFGDQELLDGATTYFIKNVSKILTTKKWQTLLREDCTLANELFIKMASR